MNKVKRFQVLLYKHNLTSAICIHSVCSIWSIYRTLSGATTPGQNGSGSKGMERELHILQISMAGASLSDGLMSYLGQSLVGSYPLQRCSRCILQPKSTGLKVLWCSSSNNNFFKLVIHTDNLIQCSVGGDTRLRITLFDLQCWCGMCFWRKSYRLRNDLLCGAVCISHSERYEPNYSLSS